jgi:hypothetical protein
VVVEIGHPGDETEGGPFGIAQVFARVWIEKPLQRVVSPAKQYFHRLVGALRRENFLNVVVQMRLPGSFLELFETQSAILRNNLDRAPRQRCAHFPPIYQHASRYTDHYNVEYHCTADPHVNLEKELSRK